jgi:hypothetical protein
MRWSVPALLLACTAAACGGGSPTSPSAAAGTASGVQGQTVSAVTGSPAANLVITLEGHQPVTSDDDGLFTVDAEPGGLYQARIRGNGVVPRETTVSASSDRMRLSVIPTSFDLDAFDEMFRFEHSRLQRWTSRPALVVIATTMGFRSTADDQFQATSEQMTEDEVTQLVSHLTEGLALLTGNTFTSFAAVDVERPAAGQRVSVTRNNRIVVGRYNGIKTLASTIGYGRWSEQPDGTIVGGAMFLDNDFDKGDARRRLLRIHELGHALGYQHVTSRTSIMNPSIGPEPTDFDRAGAVIAFQRAPGNRSPDTDPAGAPRTWSVTEGGGRWSVATGY